MESLTAGSHRQRFLSVGLLSQEEPTVRGALSGFPGSASGPRWGQVLPRRTSEQLDKSFRRQTRLLKHGRKSPTLDIFIVIGESNSSLRMVRMLQNVMAACNVMDKKSRPLQGPEDLTRLERRQALAHATSRTTFISSLTGSKDSFLSEGMGRPSLRRLSR